MEVFFLRDLHTFAVDHSLIDAKNFVNKLILWPKLSVRWDFNRTSRILLKIEKFSVLTRIKENSGNLIRCLRIILDLIGCICSKFLFFDIDGALIVMIQALYLQRVFLWESGVRTRPPLLHLKHQESVVQVKRWFVEILLQIKSFYLLFLFKSKLRRCNLLIVALLRSWWILRIWVMVRAVVFIWGELIKLEI